MLSCKNISFSYEKAVLHNINLDINSKEIIGLMGSNGCAKSTLLGLLGGLIRWQKGDLLFNQQKVIDEKTKSTNKNFRQLVGFLMQTFSSDEKITVYDNLSYAARVYNVDKKNIQYKVQEALEHANLKNVALEPVKKLSIGMRRRLELYRTFMHQPKIVFLDEPTSSLDHKESEYFFGFITDYVKKNNCLSIIATHSSNEGMICNKLAMMKEGRIIAYDTPKNYLQKLDFVMCYFTTNKALELCSLLKNFKLSVSAHNPSLYVAKINLSQLAELLQMQHLWQNMIEEFSFSRPNLHHAYEMQINSLF